MSIQKKLRAISIIMIGVLLFAYGVISTKYQFFPFPQLVSFKHFIYPGKAPENSITSTYLESRAELYSSFNSTAKNLMIGDSITEWVDWCELFPERSILNRGISGDTTYGVLKRIDNLLSTKPDKAFIMLGVNDIGQGTQAEQILENYIEIISILQSNKIIPVIQSTLYASGPYEDRNYEIKKLNQKLAGYAKKQNIEFIDLNEDLSKNEILKNEFTFDGLHLNGAGYIVWKNKIARYLKI